VLFEELNLRLNAGDELFGTDVAVQKVDGTKDEGSDPRIVGLVG
jgi:hypothetical protein